MNAGPIALVGSGEYLPQMEPVDRLLLERVGRAPARVVVLATAAGLEGPSSTQRWSRLGIQHFAHLGADVESVDIFKREDAFDERWRPRLERADFIYFSGGSPRHLIEAVRESPAWEAVARRYAGGAALAGCSAGAMAFGGHTLQPRRLWGGGAVGAELPADTWQAALRLLPGIVVLPHFDRWVGRIGQATLRALAATLPEGVTLIGVDEDTALVNFDGTAAADAPSQWQVLGRQGVSLIDAEHGRIQHRAGATLELRGNLAVN